jgi:hypothetical protein
VRLTSEFFVSALIRRANQGEAFATLERRGADKAGAIAIKVEREDRLVRLLLPASQHFTTKDNEGERFFSTAIDFSDEEKVNIRLQKELKYDPDLWVINIEDKFGRNFVEVLP